MRTATILGLLILILSFQSIGYAQTYYADLTINIEQDGKTTLSGLTNHPQLESKTTNEYTNKKASIWTFNLSLPKEDVFSDYVYEITLPPEASLNYVKSSGSFRLSGKGNQIIVYGTGQNEQLSILIQYQFASSETSNPTTPVEYYYIGAILLISLGGVIFFFLSRKKPAPEKKAQKFETSSNHDSDESMLSDRQKDILRVLKEAAGPINQTVICEKLNLPNSSMSRNVDSLERLGYVSKTRNGMSTMISLKKK